jgi:hypothetical protein
MVVLTRLAIASQAQDFFSFFFAMSHPDWSIKKKKKKTRSCPK